MKKRLVSILLAIAILISPLSVKQASALSISDVQATMDEYMAFIAQYIKDNNAKNAYWNAGLRTDNDVSTNDLKQHVDAGDWAYGLTTKKCVVPEGHYHKSPDCTSNIFGGGAQCNGFAYYLCYVVFGSYPNINNKKDTDNWKYYAKDATPYPGLQTGDFIRYWYYNSEGAIIAHSAVVYSNNNGKITVIDCNQSKKPCVIDKHQSWFPPENTDSEDYFRDNFYNKGHARIYRYKDLVENDWEEPFKYSDRPDMELPPAPKPYAVVVTKVNSQGKAPVHSDCYGDAPTIRNFTLGSKFNVIYDEENSHGNKWYKLEGDGWIYSKYVTEDEGHVHSYNSVGKCTICNANFPLNISNKDMKMEVIKTNSSGTAPAHKTPYGDADVTKRYSKGDKVSVTGSAKNAAGNLWYKLSDGSWMVSDYLTELKEHTHNYNSVGKCTVCGETFPLSISKKDMKMEVVKTNSSDTAPAHTTPYGDADVTKRYSKGDKINVVGSAKNAAGNLWYKLSDGSWMVYDYLAEYKEHTHDYNSVGKCTVCGETFPLSITSLSKTMQVSSTNSSGTAPAHKTPYGDADITKRYSKGDKVSVVGSAKNAFGNLWYKLSDGSWLVADYLTEVKAHTHDYNSVGKCTVCGETFPLSITSLSKTMQVSSTNSSGTAPAHKTPYGDADITKRYSKGDKVSVVGSAKNAFGNLWYKLSDGSWLVSDYLTEVKACDHNYDSVGKCTKCGAIFPLDITSVSKTMKVTKVNSSGTAPAHSTPYGDADITKRYNKGDTVKVVASAKNAAGNLWYKLSDGSWLVYDYLTEVATVNTKVGVVKVPSGSTGLAINDKPAASPKNSNEIGVIPNGGKCTVYPDKTSGKWYWVEYNGVQGYAYSSYITLQ